MVGSCLGGWIHGDRLLGEVLGWLWGFVEMFYVGFRGFASVFASAIA